MLFPGFNKPITGVAVPLSALKSELSLGIGEFADLPVLGRWAAVSGIDLIQLLPVNDTGFERSPYSALSAFALHPVYARLGDFPEADRNIEEISRDLTGLRSFLEAANSGGIDFDRVLEGKLKILKKLWNLASKSDVAKSEKWEKKNPWVSNYALFSLLKEENGLKSWLDWDSHRNPGEKELVKLRKKRRADTGFWVWLQWRLEAQFRTAAEELETLGISLKGDIPILINDDSADVWAQRANFSLNHRAGAPPDAAAPGGQNWGFPTYNWDFLRRDNYRWWRDRLDQAAKFYHAYRIDHVLGFFRIWAIPEEDLSALNGYFEPAVGISMEKLEEAGFDEGRIDWLSIAHFPGPELREAFGAELPVVQGFLEQVGSEDLWRAGENGPSEKEIDSSPLSSAAKERLLSGMRDRTLLSIGDNFWLPSINYAETRGWRSLSEGEQNLLETIFRESAADSETLWEQTGRELLEMMKRDGSMLVCAEDLGSIPDSVPAVLEDLGILGLKVARWARIWEEPGQPYIPLDEYPELSVATSSVHDSTTLRGWLADEAKNDEELRRLLDLDDDTDLSGPVGVKLVLSGLQKSASKLCIYPIQDLLALDPDSVSADPEDERINVPGTVQDSNWTWRMKDSLEDLLKRSGLSADLKILCDRTTGGMQ